MRDTLSIADASKATGFTPRQLRSYEATNYIRKPLRITCGEIKYRRYSPKHVSEIKEFKRLLDEGFTLSAASEKAFNLTKKGGQHDGRPAE